MSLTMGEKAKVQMAYDAFPKKFPLSHAVRLAEDYLLPVIVQQLTIEQLHAVITSLEKAEQAGYWDARKTLFGK